MIKKVFFPIILLFLITILSEQLTFNRTAKASPKATEISTDLRTIKRWVDPVTVDGALLSEMQGLPIANLRLYAFRTGIFEPVRYQIDEMTGLNGDWILPEGPLPNAELGNSKFDPWDKLLFMADDTGDKADREKWVPGYSKGVEIEITDPLTREKGWAYLLYFDSDPPARSSLPPYVRYDFETETLDTDYVLGQSIITEDGKHSNYYKHLSIPESAGGNGKNFVDRLKVRATVKIFFGTITLRLNEGRIQGDTLAFKDGPIRLIRRLEQYVLLPTGIKVLRAVADINQYRNIGNCPIIFQIPFQMNYLVSSFVINFGTDYSENAFGAKIYNSNNLQGFLVDGKMDDNEKNNFNSSFDKWRLITGDIGTFMNRTIMAPEVEKHVIISMGLVDDLEKEFPPERYPGTIGCLWQEWDVGNAPKGKYTMFLEFYWVPNYTAGDESKYLNYTDNPIIIRVGENQAKNQPLIETNLCDKYR